MAPLPFHRQETPNNENLIIQENPGIHWSDDFWTIKNLLLGRGILEKNGTRARVLVFYLFVLLETGIFSLYMYTLINLQGDLRK